MMAATISSTTSFGIIIRTTTNPSSCSMPIHTNTPPPPNSMALWSSSSSPMRSHCTKPPSSTLFPVRLGLAGLLPSRNRNRNHHRSFAASFEESKPSEAQEPDEKIDLIVQANESEEYWNQILASFKEQALKMQNVSQEAYKEYSKRAIAILEETSKQLRIQAEKAKQDLTVITKEVSEEGKEYLSTAAENYPGPVKEIVETFASSTDNLDEISKVRDFYLGIPYGLLLSFGGFLSFMITGSISAIRFGVILGGTLLALSISNMRLWKRGEPSYIALIGQTAIASILLLKDIHILFARSSFASFLMALISGAMVAFYIYRMKLEGKLPKGSNLEPGKDQ